MVAAMVSAIVVAVLVTADEAHAEPEAPVPERRRLRLDESPELTLLAPFRHAVDPGRTAIGRWRRSPFGRWSHRGFASLDWSGGHPAPGHDAAVNPRLSIGSVDPCAARLTESEPRWPVAMPREHWFEGEDSVGGALLGSTALALRRELMPPWLERVDIHWAHALVLALGCGRGGECSVGESFPASVFAVLWNSLSPLEPPSPWWECRERPLRLQRFGPEGEAFVALSCDGSIPDGALETLSVLARPLDVPRPSALPAVPTGPPGEWVDGVRIMHPRLLWVLHRISLEYPWHPVHIYSGYRPADGPLEEGTHTSNHALGRALDISVKGVENEELLALCHKLADVGCGYYPNGKFVHFDIRFHGGGLWIDASKPGEPSRYVTSWPGVVERGRVIWQKEVLVAQ